MRFRALPALAAVALLAACGGSAAPAASSSPAAAASQSAAPKPASASAKPSSTTAGASPSAAAKGGAREKLSIGYTSFTLDQLAPMVAKERGFFDQNGLEAEVISIGAGSRPEAALMANQIQMYEGGPDAMAAAVAGADLEFVGALDKDFLFWLYSVPSVKAAADLKGKSIAVTSLTSSTYTAARIGVKSLGLDVDKDVNYLPVNNPPAIFSAMQNGAAQAGSIGSTNIVQARKAGYNMLVSIADMHVPYPAGWWTVSKKWAVNHDDTMQRMLKALVQATAYILREPDGTKKILSQYAKNEDKEFLDGVYDIVSPHIQKTPYAEVQGVKLVLDDLSATVPAARNADPNTFVDNHWVKALEDSGFIAGLYK